MTRQPSTRTAEPRTDRTELERIAHDLGVHTVGSYRHWIGWLDQVYAAGYRLERAEAAAPAGLDVLAQAVDNALSDIQIVGDVQSTYIRRRIVAEYARLLRGEQP